MNLTQLWSLWFRSDSLLVQDESGGFHVKWNWAQILLSDLIMCRGFVKSLTFDSQWSWWPYMENPAESEPAEWGGSDYSLTFLLTYILIVPATKHQTLMIRDNLSFFLFLVPVAPSSMNECNSQQLSVNQYSLPVFWPFLPDTLSSCLRTLMSFSAPALHRAAIQSSVCSLSVSSISWLCLFPPKSKFTLSGDSQERACHRMSRISVSRQLPLSLRAFYLSLA